MTKDGLIERPELLEKWLESKEGQDYVIKNKLYHLKREKSSKFSRRVSINQESPKERSREKIRRSSQL